MPKNNISSSQIMPKLYLSSFSKEQWYFYIAQNSIQLENTEIEEYLESWVNEQSVCVLNDDNTLQLNFPTLPDVFSKDLVSSSGADVSHYPEGKGFKLQEKFFAYFTHSTKLAVLTTSTTLSFIVAHSHSVDGVLRSMNKSVLYQLRNRHPACDGVGLLQEAGGATYLVLVQVSLSIYSKHRSKLKHLFQVPKGKLPPELKDNKSKNVYEYYRQMVSSDVKTIYLYISPLMHGNNCSNEELAGINDEALVGGYG